MILYLPPTVRPSLICYPLTITFCQRLELLLTPNFDMQIHLCTRHTNKQCLHLHRRQPYIRYASVVGLGFCSPWPHFLRAANDLIVLKYGHPFNKFTVPNSGKETRIYLTKLSCQKQIIIETKKKDPQSLWFKSWSTFPYNQSHHSYMGFPVTKTCKICLYTARFKKEGLSRYNTETLTTKTPKQIILSSHINCPV